MSKKKIGIAAGVFMALIVSISLVTAKNTKLTGEKLDLKQTTFKVLKLSCGSCLETIEDELQKYQGMVELNADLGLGLVTVGHTKELAGPQIAEVITQAGYPAYYVNPEQLQRLQRGSPVNGNGCGSGCCAKPQQPAAR